MLERMCGTSSVVVGLHTAIKILCRTYIEAAVGTTKDICVVDRRHHSTRFRVDPGWRWPACPEISRTTMSSILRLSLKLRREGSSALRESKHQIAPRLGSGHQIFASQKFGGGGGNRIIDVSICYIVIF